MAETYSAKIVTVSRPYLVKEGNSWVSTCVYKKGDKYFRKNAVPPSLNHGPWEVGEECEVTPSEKDEEAEQWMIDIYNNPKDFRRITREAKEEEGARYDDDEPDGLTTFVNVLVVFAVIAIIGIILYTFIKGA